MFSQTNAFFNIPNNVLKAIFWGKRGNEMAYNLFICYVHTYKTKQPVFTRCHITPLQQYKV